jgi:protein TonB
MYIELLSNQIDKKTSVNEEKDSDENIYDVVEQMPSFQGGQGALLSYLSTTVKYPAEAVDKVE